MEAEKVTAYLKTLMFAGMVCCATTAMAETVFSSSVATLRLPSGVDDKRFLAREFIAKSEFLSLFEQARHVGEKPKLSTFVLDGPVQAYIEDCCATSAEAYTLLLQSGFELGPNLAVADSDFEDIRIARRRAWNSGLPAVFAYRVYEVTLMSRRSKIGGVHAISYINSGEMDQILKGNPS